MFKSLKKNPLIEALIWKNERKRAELAKIGDEKKFAEALNAVVDALEGHLKNVGETFVFEVPNRTYLQFMPEIVESREVADFYEVRQKNDTTFEARLKTIEL